MFPNSKVETVRGPKKPRQEAPRRLLPDRPVVDGALPAQAEHGRRLPLGAQGRPSADLGLLLLPEEGGARRVAGLGNGAGADL